LGVQPGNHGVAALGTLVLAVAVVALGFRELLAGNRSSVEGGLADSI
jgi:hypothetical protein